MAAESGVPDRWLLVTVSGPSEEGLDLAAEGLLAFGASAVERADGEARTWLPPPADPELFMNELSAALAADGLGSANVNWCWRPAEDWSQVWRRGLRPRRVGPALIVRPSWTEAAEIAGVAVITIDPQMAFGTGEHASTRGVLRLLQRRLRRRDRVLDVGTGSGIVAIAAAKLGAACAHGVECDTDALGNAAENIARNGVADRVTLEHADVDDVYLAAHAATWDLIIANVLSSVLIPLLPGFRHALASAGGLVLGGILAAEANAMTEAAGAAGLRHVEEDVEEEWWSGLFTAA